MDSNLWRNFNPTHPRLDVPLHQTEQSGHSIGALPLHANLAGTRPVQGLPGSSVSQVLDQGSLFTRHSPYKPTDLGSFSAERTLFSESDQFGLSPTKQNFSQDHLLGIVDDKTGSWDLSSPGFGELPADLSSPIRSVPTLAHGGISNFHHTPGHQGAYQNSSIHSQTLNSQISEKLDLRQEESYCLSSRREGLSEAQYSYPSLPSQQYTVRQDSRYHGLNTTSTGPQIDHFTNYSSAQTYRNEDHFDFSDVNLLHQQNYRPIQNQEVELPTSTYRPIQNQEVELPTSTYRPNQNQETGHTTGTYHPVSFSHSTPLPLEKTTIQAVADSTTKPRKGRGRKKRETSEDSKSFEEKKLVESYIQQEQNIHLVSQNRVQDNSYRQSPHSSQILGNVYGQTFRNNAQSSSPYNMQSPQISSSKSTSLLGQGSNNYPAKNPNQVGSNYNRGPMVDSLGQRSTNFTNSSENFHPHQKNNFMQQGFMSSDASIPITNPERIIDNNGYPCNEPSCEPSFVDQLNSNSDFDALNSMDLDSGIYSGTGNIFNVDTFTTNAQQQNNSFCGGSTSTVDEAALSSLITDNHPDRKDEKIYEAYSCDQEKPYVAEPAVPPTAISSIDEDDEFKHLKKPPEVEKKEVKSQIQLKVQPSVSEKKPNLQPRVVIEPLPLQKIVTKPTPTKSTKNNAFMDSFLSFIQGKKPETLSSVNSSVVKKPELPKYIPEPKRPPRQTSVEKSSDSNASTPRPETDTKSETPSIEDTTSSRATISDEETQVTGTVKNIDSGNEDHPSLKMTIKLQTVSPPKQKKSKTKSSGKQKRSVSYRESEDEGVKSSGEEYQVGSSVEEEEKESTPSPAAPVRRSSTRKAKEQILKKKYKESDSEVEDVPPETYDSDSDPAWTPIAEEKKEPSFDDYAGSQRRGRSWNPKSKIKPKRAIKQSKPTPAKIRKVEPPRVAHPRIPTPEPESSSDTEEESGNSTHFMIGSFVINKKDINNFEGYPIWKIEAGKMMRKYELFIDKGEIFHRSLSTYSSWLQNMEKNYLPVKTKLVPNIRTSNRDSQYVVQVLEEDRPKPTLESSKETEYEKDPLADMFNVFLQVFLSQAMEPGFLKAIHESEEDFYLKPLKLIDNIISKKLMEISSKVRWKIDFKRTAELRPHIREVERPNLKTLCQATENSTQTAMKSVHLFGQPYDRITLEETPDNAAQQGSMEYLVGKTASNYIAAYHSLHHFKYNLYKRCLAKVDIVREGNTELDNAEILDKCLNNRIWVLKIFDDLKNMLEKG